VRRRLLEAGRELINELGVPQLRVEDVASQAGLSVGTFYLYFEGKDDLFANLVIEYTARLRERMREAYQGPGSLAERLAASLDAYLDFVESNEQGFLYFRDAGTIDTNVGRLSSWALDQHAADLRPLIEEGIKTGEFREMDPEHACQALVGLTQHMAGWWLEHRDHCPRPDLTQFLRMFTGLGLSGRAPEEPDPSG
jgi:AcrR family transcriptional regulator